MTVYKVTGPPFRGHATGEEFEAELDPGQERRAKERGQIRVVKRDTKHEHEKEENTDAEADRAN